MTAQDSRQPTDRQRPRFQFTLRGMMVFVLGAAMGLSIWRMELPSQEDGIQSVGGIEVQPGGRILAMVTAAAEGLIAAVSVWIVLGVAMQIRDLWTAFRGCRELSRDERCGWLLAMLWRVAVVCLVVAYYAVRVLLNRGVIELVEMEDTFQRPGADAREGLLLLCMILVLSSVAAKERREQTGLASSLLNVAKLAVGMVVAVILCAHNTLIQFLVAVTVQGIELSQSAQFVPKDCGGLPWDRAERFHRESALVLGLTLLSLGAAFALAGQWTRGPRRRLLWGALFATSFMASAAAVGWLFGVAFPRAFPMMIEAQRPWPAHVWASSILLVGMACSAGAYRVVHGRREETGQLNIGWRTRPRYYHERIGVILLLAVGVGAQLPGILTEFTRLTWITYVLLDLAVRGTCLLRLVVLLTAVGAVWRLVRRGGAAASGGPLPLAPGHFGALWLALFLTALTLIPAISVFGFTLWFTPWCTAHWP